MNRNYFHFFLTENLHHKYYSLLQTKNENISQLDFLPKMITRASTATRPIDHNNDEIRSLQSTTTEKIVAQKSNQKFKIGFKLQTQSTFVSLNQNKNIIEITESISFTEVTGSFLPPSSVLIPGFTIPLQVPTKTIRSNSKYF